jgi:hypothetical protein
MPISIQELTAQIAADMAAEEVIIIEEVVIEDEWEESVEWEYSDDDYD